MASILSFLQQGVEGTQHILFPKRATLSVVDASTFVITVKGKKYFTGTNVTKLQLTQKGITFDVPSITGNSDEIQSKVGVKESGSRYIDGHFNPDGEHYHYTWTGSLHDIRIKYGSFILEENGQMFYLGEELKIISRHAHQTFKASDYTDATFRHAFNGVELLQAGLTVCKTPAYESKVAILPHYLIKHESMPYVDISELITFNVSLNREVGTDLSKHPEFIGGLFVYKQIVGILKETNAQLGIVAHGDEISVQMDGIYYLPKGLGLVKGYKIPPQGVVEYTLEDGTTTYNSIDISNRVVGSGKFNKERVFFIDLNTALADYLNVIFPQA